MWVPDVAGLDAAEGELRGWQVEGRPVQLHPGDLGWNHSAGASAAAANVRLWSGGGPLAAVGLLDGPVLRLALDPAFAGDADLAREIAADLDGGLATSIEARAAEALVDVLRAAGWAEGEHWTPLHRSLAEPVTDCGLRVETVGADLVSARTAVHRASFERSTYDDARWRSVAAGPSYDDARCLLAFDAADVPVAAATVWSAGLGRPGLIEPLGAHRDHRGHGYGRAITVAAAAALREMGASSVTVCTPSANVRGVAAYRSAGFTELPEVPDLTRGA